MAHFGKLWTIFPCFGSFQIISSDLDLLSFIFMIHFASFDSIQWLGTCYLKPFRAFCVTGFFLFWLIFELFYPILANFELFWVILTYFHPFLWFILLHFGSICVTGFFLFWLNFVNWTLVGIFCSILIHFNDWFWSIWIISVTRFSLFCFSLVHSDNRF